LFTFSGFGNINLETVIAAVALISTAVAWLVDRYILRRKRLVYRVQVDAQIGVFPGEDKTQRMVDVEVRHQGVVVEDPSMSCSGWTTPAAWTSTRTTCTRGCRSHFRTARSSA